MMSNKTIFNGDRVVFDAMVIINFHSLLVLDKLVDWANGEIVVEIHIIREAQYSQSGEIDLNQYIQRGAIVREDIADPQQESLFLQYLKTRISDTTVHKGEAACLALAISKGYGLACDEKLVREEFKRKCPSKICVSSWMIVDKAVKLSLINSQNAAGLKKGFFYT